LHVSMFVNKETTYLLTYLLTPLYHAHTAQSCQWRRIWQQRQIFMHHNFCK